MLARRVLMILGIAALLALMVRDILTGEFLMAAAAWLAISLNGAVVMAAWGERDGSSDITMLADGNGAFADAIGLTMDGSKFGLGQRSQRYSMIVKDGVVEQLNVEGPGEYRASSAEQMLEQLQPA